MNDKNENLIIDLLEGLAEESGIDFGEILSDALEIPGDVETYPLDEEPTDDEPLDMDNDYSDRSDDYFDHLFDDLDVDYTAEQDQYGDD